MAKYVVKGFDCDNNILCSVVCPLEDFLNLLHDLLSVENCVSVKGFSLDDRESEEI